MTAKPKIELCPSCRYDGGWHYDDDGNATRPHHDAAKLHEHAETVVAEASKRQVEAALLIVKDAAETMQEFSANNLAAEFDAAQIDSSGATGQAFRIAHQRGWIEDTKQRIASTKKGTNGAEVKVWRSLRFGARRAAS